MAHGAIPLFQMLRLCYVKKQNSLYLNELKATYCAHSCLIIELLLVISRNLLT